MYGNENTFTRRLRPVDVICEHSRDGVIIPIRLRLTDEDGLQQTYDVKGYCQMQINGSYTTMDGVYVTRQDVVYVCRILTNETMRNIRLYYAPQTGKWQLAG